MKTDTLMSIAYVRHLLYINKGHNSNNILVVNAADFQSAYLNFKISPSAIYVVHLSTFAFNRIVSVINDKCAHRES
jgi:hypothetical protein